MDRSDGRRLQLRRAAGSPTGQRPAGLPARPRCRRADVRTGRAFDLPQPVGHHRPSTRSLSSQSGGRRAEPERRLLPASTIAWSSSKRDSTSACSTTTTPARACWTGSTASDTNLQSVRDGNAQEEGDFLGSVYETRIRRNPDRIQVLLSREGYAGGRARQTDQGRDRRSRQFDAAKSPTCSKASRRSTAPFRCRVQLRRSAVPRRGSLLLSRESTNDWANCTPNSIWTRHSDLCLADQWLGIDVRMVADQPTSWWTFPIETVSQSEGGFELVHQSVVVQPHWFVRGDAQGRWSVDHRTGTGHQPGETAHGRIDRRRRLLIVRRANGSRARTALLSPQRDAMRAAQSGFSTRCANRFASVCVPHGPSGPHTIRLPAGIWC